MNKLALLIILTTSVFAQLKYERAIDWNLPDPVQKRFESAHLLDSYDISDRVNPFYLRGDFDGDGEPDYAVLVTNKKSKKSAVAFTLTSKTTVDVIGGEGVKLRVGSKDDGYDLQDFDWMDAWQVHRRVQLPANELNTAATIHQMLGEGVMVEKTEAASALIYWDGKSFRWYQLGD